MHRSIAIALLIFTLAMLVVPTIAAARVASGGDSNGRSTGLGPSRISNGR